MSKWRTRFGILAVLALAATFLVIIPATAATSGNGTVDTGAIIGGDSTLAPQIVCKWELPDVDGDSGNGMQYGNDDSPTVNPGGPCQGIDPEMWYQAGMVVIDVKANAEDMPTEQRIELWTAVRGARNVSDIDSVIFDVYHPDGTLKVQTHAKMAPESVEELGATFNSTTNEWTVRPGSMWYAASMKQTGQIANETLASQQGIIARAKQNDLSLWRTYFDLSKHQPCGEYEIRERATFLGFTSEISNYVNVLCFTNLEADFSSVQWDAVTPGGTDYVYGDLDFDPQGNSPWPTVKNTGSGAMALGIAFTPMKEINDKDPNSVKLITEFDAAFGINPSYLKTLDPIMAGEKALFGNGYYQILCANETGKLDLSIHPPVGLPAGEYVGSLTLWGIHTPNGEGYTSPCLNENGIWDPPNVRRSPAR